MFTKIQSFFEKLPKNKVYIIPTKEGFVFGVINIILVLIGITYSNNSILLIGFTFFSIFIMHAFITNNTLESLELINISYSDDIINNGLNLSFDKGRKGAISFNFSIKVNKTSFTKNVVEQKLLSTFSIFSKLEGISRGKYEIKRMQVSTSYPLNFFYSWKYLEFPEIEIYIYPEINMNYTSKFHELYVQSESTNANYLSSDQRYKEHKKYAVGDALQKVDWFKYGRERKIYTKVFESNEKREQFLKIKMDSNESEISIVSSAMFLMQKNQDVWNIEIGKLNYVHMSTRSDLKKCLKLLSQI